MKTLNYLFGITLPVIFLSTAYGFEQKEMLSDKPKSEYQGPEIREIKSLSKRDIKALQRGTGWSLAKAAELNGMPGPAHVLELKGPLNLTEKQIDQVRRIWQQMQDAAKKQGLVYIAAEQEIEDFFKRGPQDPERLNDLLQNSAISLAELRKVHLIAHLKTRPLLTKHQIIRYSELRGYSSGAHPSRSHQPVKSHQSAKGHHYYGHHW